MSFVAKATQSNKSIFDGNVFYYRSWRETLVESVRGVSGFEITFQGLPPPPAPNLEGLEPTARSMAMQQHSRELDQYVSRRNASYEKILSSISTKVFPLVRAAAGNPHIAIQILDGSYSSEVISQGIRIAQVQNFKKIKMDPSEFFNLFALDFLSKKVEADIGDLEAISVLGTAIPKRLATAFEHCQAEEFNLNKCIEYLSRQDDRIRVSESHALVEKKLRKVSHNFSGKVVMEDEADPGEQSVVICYHCKNPGHKAKECKTTFCAKCCSFNGGHNTSACTTSKKPVKKPVRSGTSFSNGKSNYATRSKTPTPTSTSTSTSTSLSEETPLQQRKKQRQLRCEDDEFLDELTKSFRQIRAYRQLSSARSKLAKLDSGADVHGVPDASFLSDVVLYDSSNLAPKLYLADNSPLPVVGIGNIDEIIQQVYICPNLDQPLISASLLAQKGCTIIHCPEGIRQVAGVASPGAFIFGENGNVLYVVDRDFNFDVGVSPPQVTMEEVLGAIQRKHVSSLRLHGTKFSTAEDAAAFVHQALGHPSAAATLDIAISRSIINFPLTEKQVKSNPFACVACLKGKSRRARFVPVARPMLVKEPSRVRLESKVATDFFIPGLINGATHTCASTFVDSQTQLLMGFPQRTKDEIFVNVATVIREFRRSGRAIEVLQSDSEPIFKSEALRVLLAENDVKAQFAAPYRHEQVGAGEQVHRTIKERIICMFAAAPHMPLTLWHYAYVKAIQCLNRTPRYGREGQSPFELFYGKKPDFAEVGLPFGQLIHIVLPRERRGPLDPRTVVAAYVGLTTGSKDCIDAFVFSTRRVIATRDFILVTDPEPYLRTTEHFFPQLPVDQLNSSTDTTIIERDGQSPAALSSTETPRVSLSTAATNVGRDVQPHVTLETPASLETPVTMVTVDSAHGFAAANGASGVPETSAITAPLVSSAVTDVVTSGTEEDSVEERGEVIPTPVTATVPDVVSTPPPRYNLRGLRMYIMQLLLCNLIPSLYCIVGITMKEARRSERWPAWQQAMTAEMKQMEDRDVFQILPTLPRGAKALRTHFVLDEKFDAAGNFEKLKARLVADGNHQNKETFEQVASPTARITSVKLLAAIAAKLGLALHGYDVPGAYLHVNISSSRSMRESPTIYLTLPDGRTAKLNKFLYGMKQSGLEWYHHHRSQLEALGYVASQVEPCMFVWRSTNDHGKPFKKGESFHIIVTWVDDDLGMASDAQVEQRYYKHMCSAYGDVKRKCNDFSFVGFYIQHLQDGSIRLSQPSYYKDLAEVAGIPDSGRIVSTPMSHQIVDQEDDMEPANQSEYLRILGSLNYLVGMTRCDGAFLVSIASTKVSSPTKRDLRILKRGIRYFINTSDYGITFRADGPINLVCYVDASYTNHQDAKSQTGYLFALGEMDPAFYAKSSKQKLTALSSTEAEYIALCEATKEVCFFRQLLTDMGFPSDSPTPVYEDNSACIQFTKGFMNHKNTKHISVRFHFSKDKVEDGTITMMKIGTDHQRADYLTKSLNSESTLYFRDLDLSHDITHAREGDKGKMEKRRKH